MDYDDLILSLLADRLDFLFRQRRGAVGHIADLLVVEPTRTRHKRMGTVAAMIERIATDLDAHAPDPSAMPGESESILEMRRATDRPRLRAKKARVG
jgi:hypothetical protein